VEITLGLLLICTQENTNTANGHLVLAGTLLGEQCSRGKILQDEYDICVRENIFVL